MLEGLNDVLANLENAIDKIKVCESVAIPQISSFYPFFFFFFFKTPHRVISYDVCLSLSD